MRVLIVTEIRLYRDGVAAALGALPDVVCAETAASVAAAVMTARRTECDVVVLDMSMEASTETAAALLAARPGIKLVALAVPEEESRVVACAEAGVHGYISREATFADLADALRAALRGEAACSGKVAAGLMHHIALVARSRQSIRVPTQLTKREREVLRLLETGMSNMEIARALDLQLSTVKNHVHNVLAKIGASGRSEIATALANGTKEPVLGSLPD